MITIGIPKALLFFEYKVLWKYFFEKLGCKIIISPDSNKEIEYNGKNKCLDEACLSLKLYFGHVNYLIDKCDYVLVPRIVRLNKKEKTCTNFYALYDMLNNTFDNIKILDYNIDKNISEEKAFIKMGKKLGFPYSKIKEAYNYAKIKELEEKKKNINKQEFLLTSNNKKVLIIGTSYTVYDKLIGFPIIKYLKDNKINVIIGNIYDDKYLDQEYINISTDIYWTYNKKLLGALWHYKDKVDGIILLSSFPCGPNSLINDLVIRKIKDKPILNIVIDDLNSETGLITRLESFIDIIEAKEECL